MATKKHRSRGKPRAWHRRRTGPRDPIERIYAERGLDLANPPRANSRRTSAVANEVPEIDLHGYSVMDALAHFAEWYNGHLKSRTLKVIHGYGSTGSGGAIREALRRVLDQNRNLLRYHSPTGNMGVTIILPLVSKPLPGRRYRTARETMIIRAPNRTAMLERTNGTVDWDRRQALANLIHTFRNLGKGSKSVSELDAREFVEKAKSLSLQEINKELAALRAERHLSKTVGVEKKKTKVHSAVSPLKPERRKKPELSTELLEHIENLLKREEVTPQTKKFLKRFYREIFEKVSSSTEKEAKLFVGGH